MRRVETDQASSFPETVERLEAEIEEGLFTRGAQVCVSLADEVVLDLALGEDGLGRPMRVDTIFRVYCTIKPVAALAVANLVDMGLIDLDGPLSETLPSVEAVRGGVTTRHLLNHTAGLHLLSGVTLEMVPPDKRDAFFDRQSRAPGWKVGHDAGYSEIFAWSLLGRLIETVTQTPLRIHLRQAVLDPLGMEQTSIGLDAEDFAEEFDRLGVNVDLRGWRAFPLLFERTQRVRCETNCAHGGYTTASDLDRLYRAILRGLAGEQVPGLPLQSTLEEFTSPARPRTFDVVLDRECDYGLGFMADLEDHRFGTECSPRSFGHSGNVGSSYAFADPEPGLSVAVVFNGIVDPDSSFFRRPALTRAIYADIGLDREPEPVENEPVESAKRGGLFRRRRSG